MRIIYIMMLLAATASGADDPGGWSKARWGMTDPQLAAAFPDATRGQRNSRTVLDLPVRLADAACVATLVIGPDGKLDHVVIAAPTDATDTIFQRLEDLLVSKYGRPWETKEDHGVSRLQWSFKTTIVQLQRVKIGDLSAVSITYRPRPADLDKL